jgi:RHS repeat-associated protein
VASRTGQPGRLRFAGQRADELTGLYYNRHRYYAPDLHVFLTPDPLALLSTLQDVGYVPNPTIFIDPLGLVTIINGSPGDPVMKDTIRRIKQKYPDAKVITSDKLGKSPSLWQKMTGKRKNANMIDANEDNVIITTHGEPAGVQWKGGNNNRATGDEIGEQLRNAGFKGKGKRVDLLACNGATPGKNGEPSVAQGIANKTDATTWGAMSNDPGMTYRNEPSWEGNFVKPRPWYNFWSKSVTNIDEKDYVDGPKGVIHPGEMSGTPWDPKVHGVAKDPRTGSTWRHAKTGKPTPISGPEGYIPVGPKP